MVEELIWILPWLVFFEDGVENLLLGFAAFGAADVSIVYNFRINIHWVVVVNYDFVNAEDCCCAGDAAHLDGFVIWFSGIVEPGSWEGNADSPVTGRLGLKDCCRPGCVEVGFFLFILGCAFSSLTRVLSGILVYYDVGCFSFLVVMRISSIGS